MPHLCLGILKKLCKAHYSNNTFLNLALQSIKSSKFLEVVEFIFHMVHFGGGSPINNPKGLFKKENLFVS